MRISDWSSDVCSSDLPIILREADPIVLHNETIHVLKTVDYICLTVTDHLDLDQSVGAFLFINSLNSIYDPLHERGIDTSPRANILTEAFYVDITHPTHPFSALVFCRVAVFGLLTKLIGCATWRERGCK